MRTRIGIGLCAALLIAFVMLPELLVYRTCPGRDSGGALYAGWRILNGAALYRDVWDHRAPLLYYLNALGLLIGGGSTWGVIACEFLAIACAVSLGLKMMLSEYGIAPALCGSAVWVLSLPLVLEGGNLPEEYALPFQFAALMLFTQVQKQGCRPRSWFLIGIMGAAAFSLRPNLVGIWISMAIVLLIRPSAGVRLRGRGRGVAMMLSGMACAALAIAGFCAFQGEVGGLWDAVFRYNLAYSSTAAADRLRAIREGFRLLSGTGLAPMAACGWVCALFRLAAPSACPRPERSTLQLLIVAFPVEIALAGASGRAYHHYYTAWLPVFALLASFLFLVLASWWRVSCSSLGMADERMRWVGGIALCCVLMAAGVYPLRVVAQQILGAHSEAWARQQREAVAFVSRATGGDDYLLVWGAEPSINFLSKRRCPSRFSFQYPLFTRGYQNGKMVAELISDIAGRSPAFLIDTSSSNTLVPPLDPEMREKWRSPNPVYGLIPEMDGLFEFIGMRYQRICTVGPLRWSVYARRA